MGKTNNEIVLKEALDNNVLVNFVEIKVNGQTVDHLLLFMV